MKVLVTYYSETGNTEKVAKAIYEEVSRENKADLKKVKDTNPEEFGEYDLVFLGSPIRSFDLPIPVKKILAALPKAPKYKFAGFITHMSPVSEKHAGQEKCFAAFENLNKEKQVDLKGVYDCEGVPTPQVREFVRKSFARELPDAEWERRVKEMEKHPDTEDLQKAKEFAKQVLAKI